MRAKYTKKAIIKTLKVDMGSNMAFEADVGSKMAFEVDMRSIRYHIITWGMWHPPNVGMYP